MEELVYKRFRILVAGPYAESLASKLLHPAKSEPFDSVHDPDKLLQDSAHKEVCGKNDP